MQRLTMFYLHIWMTSTALKLTLQTIASKPCRSRGHEMLTVQAIFVQLTQHYEKLFFEDMHALNVLDPDEITRVTEFVPQINEFVEKIIEKGFAYQTEQGNVYFDIDSFEKEGNAYCRLEPQN